MKELKSNYAYMNDDVILLTQRKKNHSRLREDEFKNVTIYFLENGCIEIKAENILYGFSFDGFFVNDNTEISESFITKRFNLFKFKKMPYVKYGWYQLKETKKINIIKNKYEIINYD